MVLAGCLTAVLFTPSAPAAAPWLPACEQEDGPGPCVGGPGRNGKGVPYVLGPGGELYRLVTAEQDFTARMEAQSRKRVGTVRGHANCWVLVGPTSHLQCQDGYGTES